jgi:hypothetical protein
MSFIDFVEVLECIAGAGKTAFPRQLVIKQRNQLLMLELPLFGIQKMVDDVYIEDNDILQGISSHCRYLSPGNHTSHWNRLMLKRYY